MRQTRSIKGDIELPVAIHEAHDGQRVCCLSSPLCLTRKHSVSQGKDKERLMKLKFQGCFLVFLVLLFLLCFIEITIISFSFHSSIHWLYSSSYSGSYSIFPLILRI